MGYDCDIEHSSELGGRWRCEEWYSQNITASLPFRLPRSKLEFYDLYIEAKFNEFNRNWSRLWESGLIERNTRPEIWFSSDGKDMEITIYHVNETDPYYWEDYETYHHDISNCTRMVWERVTP
jgi:hypothetical protein